MPNHRIACMYMSSMSSALNAVFLKSFYSTQTNIVRDERIKSGLSGLIKGGEFARRIVHEV